MALFMSSLVENSTTLEKRKEEIFLNHKKRRKIKNLKN